MVHFLFEVFQSLLQFYKLAFVLFADFMSERSDQLLEAVPLLACLVFLGLHLVAQLLQLLLQFQVFRLLTFNLLFENLDLLAQSALILHLPHNLRQLVFHFLMIFFDLLVHP